MKFHVTFIDHVGNDDVRQWAVATNEDGCGYCHVWKYCRDENEARETAARLTEQCN